MQRSEARSEPASGSEKPWLHQMSRLAVLGRNFFFCSSVPNWASTGPIIEALKASGVGTNARCSSSCQMWRCRSVQPRPPHSSGQCGTARPAALSVCMLSTYCSFVSSRPSATAVRISSDTSVVKNVRISSRNAFISSDSSSCIPTPYSLVTPIMPGRP